MGDRVWDGRQNGCACDAAPRGPPPPTACTLAVCDRKPSTAHKRKDATQECHVASRDVTAWVIHPKSESLGRAAKALGATPSSGAALALAASTRYGPRPCCLAAVQHTRTSSTHATSSHRRPGTGNHVSLWTYAHAHRRHDRTSFSQLGRNAKGYTRGAPV